MNLEKQYIRQLKKISESTDVFNSFKEKYPEPFEEKDITDKYIDFLMEKVSPAIGNEEQIKRYRDSVKITKRVSYSAEHTGYVRVSIRGYYYNESMINGHVSLQTNPTSKDHTSMEVFAGFLHNPIGQIRNRYTLNNPLSILNDEDAVIKDLIREMADAMESSRSASKSYADYVRRTGDMS